VHGAKNRRKAAARENDVEWRRAAAVFERQALHLSREESRQNTSLQCGFDASWRHAQDADPDRGVSNAPSSAKMLQAIVADHSFAEEFA